MGNTLVPVDGSPSSLRALAFALHAMRRESDARVHVLNVQAPLIHVWVSKLVTPDMIDAKLRSDGKKVLVQAEMVALSAGIACVPYVSIGAVAEEINAYATRYGCDAIVMGTRGMGVVAGLVLGSVAQRVVHLATVPVTLVK